MNDLLSFFFIVNKIKNKQIGVDSLQILTKEFHHHLISIIIMM